MQVSCFASGSQQTWRAYRPKPFFTWTFLYEITDNIYSSDLNMEPTPFPEEASERKVSVVGSELVENYTVSYVRLNVS